MAKKSNRKASKETKKLAKTKEEETLTKLAEEIKNFEGECSNFEDLPLTEATLQGLKEASFVKCTDIQRQSIPYILKGKDIMATARTGSGKTLAFLIPTIERLVHERITEFDGLAALIVSPTRELAVQIFEVLTKIGKYNTFSAGLVTGGKDVKYEKERVSRMNILVGTPGRLAQHFNEAIGLETSNLQVLVLDEADRCLDMGFKRQIDSILGHLPPTRQTLLFSATQSESVQDLARLSLANPIKIGVSDDNKSVSQIPESLSQYYINVPLNEKLDILWSFIKSHLKSKILVFFSSSRQVQYAYESFRTLQPGIPLLRLYGRHKQTSRLETTVKFSHAQHACLFATDIVARGLDFPAIDWVIQVDCPEDPATYVHRVGRAARFGKKGKSLLMLLPSEENMLKHLTKIERMNIKSKMKKSIKPQLQSLCFQSPVMKNLAQRAFISYFRSVHIQKDKEIFNLEALPAEKYAESLGLSGAPKIKIKGTASGASKEKKNASRKLLQLEKADDNGDVHEEKKVRNKYDRMFERQNQTVLSDKYTGITQRKDEDDDEEEDDFMKIKRKDHELRELNDTELAIPTSKRQAKKALSRKASAKGQPKKLTFDDDGVAHAIYELEDEEDFRKAGDAKAQKAAFVEKETELMTAADKDDKALAKEKRQEKKRKRKEAEKRAREEFDESDEVDLDRDMESSDDEADQPKEKKPKWFEENNKNKKTIEEIEEIEQPDSLEDLEALTQRLIQG